ncbi:MAG: hypothetical protein ACOYEA_05320 [Fermentimonas sp.]|jgi:hypothetical protein
MEKGALIQFIIFLAMAVIGLVSESNKKQKKKAEDQSTPPPVPPVRHTPKHRSFLDDIESTVHKPKMRPDKHTLKRERPITPPKYEGQSVFQSSMDLVTDFRKESSLSQAMQEHSIHDYRDISENISFNYEMDDPHEAASDAGISVKQHPIVKQLKGPNRQHELAKGVIYGEILNRKY